MFSDTRYQFSVRLVYDRPQNFLLFGVLFLILYNKIVCVNDKNQEKVRDNRQISTKTREKPVHQKGQSSGKHRQPSGTRGPHPHSARTVDHANHPPPLISSSISLHPASAKPA